MSEKKGEVDLFERLINANEVPFFLSSLLRLTPSTRASDEIIDIYIKMIKKNCPENILIRNTLWYQYFERVNDSKYRQAKTEELREFFQNKKQSYHILTPRPFGGHGYLHGISFEMKDERWLVNVGTADGYNWGIEDESVNWHVNIFCNVKGINRRELVFGTANMRLKETQLTNDCFYVVLKLIEKCCENVINGVDIYSFGELTSLDFLLTRLEVFRLVEHFYLFSSVEREKYFDLDLMRDEDVVEVLEHIESEVEGLKDTNTCLVGFNTGENIGSFNHFDYVRNYIYNTVADFTTNVFKISDNQFSVLLNRINYGNITAGFFVDEGSDDENNHDDVLPFYDSSDEDNDDLMKIKSSSSECSGVNNYDEDKMDIDKPKDANEIDKKNDKMDIDKEVDTPGGKKSIIIFKKPGQNLITQYSKFKTKNYTYNILEKPKIKQQKTLKNKIEIAEYALKLEQSLNGKIADVGREYNCERSIYDWIKNLRKMKETLQLLPDKKKKSRKRLTGGGSKPSLSVDSEIKLLNKIEEKLEKKEQFGKSSFLKEAKKLAKKENSKAKFTSGYYQSFKYRYDVSKIKGGQSKKEYSKTEIMNEVKRFLKLVREKQIQNIKNGFLPYRDIDTIAFDEFKLCFETDQHTLAPKGSKNVKIKKFYNSKYGVTVNLLYNQKRCICCQLIFKDKNIKDKQDAKECRKIEGIPVYFLLCRTKSGFQNYGSMRMLHKKVVIPYIKRKNKKDEKKGLGPSRTAIFKDEFYAHKDGKTTNDELKNLNEKYGIDDFFIKAGFTGIYQFGDVIIHKSLKQRMKKELTKRYPFKRPSRKEFILLLHQLISEIPQEKIRNGSEDKDMLKKIEKSISTERNSYKPKGNLKKRIYTPLIKKIIKEKKRVRKLEKKLSTKNDMLKELKKKNLKRKREIEFAEENETKKRKLSKVIEKEQETKNKEKKKRTLVHSGRIKRLKRRSRRRKNIKKPR